MSFLKEWKQSQTVPGQSAEEEAQTLDFRISFTLPLALPDLFVESLVAGVM